MRHGIPHWPLAALSLLLGLAACTNTAETDATAHRSAPRSLYDRLGGQPVLAPAMDDLMTILAADPRIARRFRDADTAHFRAAFMEQVCVSTGGPCRSTGRPMADVHAGMGISDAEFNAMTQDLRHALGRHAVPPDLQTEVAAALEPLRDAIVSPLPPTRSVVTAPMMHRPATTKPGVGKPGGRNASVKNRR